MGVFVYISVYKFINISLKIRAFVVLRVLRGLVW